MKILYIHQYFVTPKQPGGTRSYWISKELIKNGHEVIMLTATKDKNKPREMVIDGIKVIYLKIPYDNHMGIFKRLISFLKFMILSALYVLRTKKPDLVIGTSTPLTVGFPLLVGKKLRKLPYVFEVRDLWPEVPVQMGGIKNKLAIKLLYRFEKSIYKNSLHVVALSPGMEDGVIKAGTPECKVTTIPNMSKIDKFWPREKNQELMKELNLRPDTFKVIYFGAMGLANGMEYIIDGARHLKDEKDIEFLFVGDGSTKPLLEERAKNEGLDFMHFYGKVPMAKLSETVNLSDVSLVTFADLPILATNSPNKLFDTLSAGKPLIVNSPGWTKTMVESEKCGVFVDPKNPKELAEQILAYKNDPKRRDEFGKNARILAEKKFDKSILCKQFAEVINNIDTDYIKK
ncbi:MULTISPECIES: glycosyltransferase family 4 protein [Flavobacteriaceae]|uniref:glycosyltransferase family 4 protein n=1 Tax=Flavobacteriaceae TaxID=49546 RepID=UPI001490C1A8|nr:MULTISPECIES: glycosyltransferase family 4 protein [Allomuricauda]MDC6366872.1 glycosyltransferase family 4 protein [Muricauda sp. AC10]